MRDTPNGGTTWAEGMRSILELVNIRAHVGCRVAFVLWAGELQAFFLREPVFADPIPCSQIASGVL